MAMLNYSTRIAATKTISEMQNMLANGGASRVAVEFDNSIPVGLSFLLPTPHGPRHFTLPVDVNAMQTVLKEQDEAGKLKSGSKAERTSLDQSGRVAWRVMKDWLAAQMALVETRMVQMDQVMLPYLQVDDSGRTLYAAYKEEESFRAITAQ